MENGQASGEGATSKSKAPGPQLGPLCLAAAHGRGALPPGGHGGHGRGAFQFRQLGQWSLGGRNRPPGHGAGQLCAAVPPHTVANLPAPTRCAASPAAATRPTARSAALAAPGYAARVAPQGWFGCLVGSLSGARLRRTRGGARQWRRAVGWKPYRRAVTAHAWRRAAVAARGGARQWPRAAAAAVAAAHSS